jgi:hypothetical protein
MIWGNVVLTVVFPIGAILVQPLVDLETSIGPCLGHSPGIPTTHFNRTYLSLLPTPPARRPNEKGYKDENSTRWADLFMTQSSGISSECLLRGFEDTYCVFASWITELAFSPCGLSLRVDEAF